MLKAIKSVSGKIKILGVTTLTSLDNNDLKEIGYDKNLKQIVIKLAKIARLAKLEGIICSANEAKYLNKIWNTGKAFWKKQVLFKYENINYW